jgi:hypothetical protein
LLGVLCWEYKGMLSNALYEYCKVSESLFNIENAIIDLLPPRPTLESVIKIVMVCKFVNKEKPKEILDKIIFIIKTQKFSKTH